MEPFVPTAESQPVPLEQERRNELVRAIASNSKDPSGEFSDARVIDLVRRGGLRGYTDALASYVQLPQDYGLVHPHIALKCSMPVLEALLAAGASPNASRADCAPVLCASLYDPAKEKFEALLAAGANPSACLERQDGVCASALSVAICALTSQPDECYATVEALLRAGANPDGADDVPLAIAAAVRHRRVVQLLLVYGANTSRKIGFDLGVGSYETLKLKKNEEVLEYLHRYDAWDEDYGIGRMSSVPPAILDIMCDIVHWEAGDFKSDAPEGASPEQHAASRRTKGAAAGAFARWDYAKKESTLNYLVSMYY